MTDVVANEATHGRLAEFLGYACGYGDRCEPTRLRDDDVDVCCAHAAGGECLCEDVARELRGFPAARFATLLPAHATAQRACALMARRMHVHVGVGGASNQGAADVSKDVTPPPRRCRERTGDGVTQAVAVPARVWIGICLFWSLWQGSTRVPLKPLANGPDAATDGTLKHNNRESLLKRCMARSGRQS